MKTQDPDVEGLSCSADTNAEGEVEAINQGNQEYFSNLSKNWSYYLILKEGCYLYTNLAATICIIT